MFRSPTGGAVVGRPIPTHTGPLLPPPIEAQVSAAPVVGEAGVAAPLEPRTHRHYLRRVLEKND